MGALAQEVVIREPSASLLQQLSVWAAPIAALLGVLLGGWLEYIRERAASRHARYGDVYKDFLGECYRCARLIHALFMSPPDEQNEKADACRVAVDDVQLMSLQVRVYGSDRVYEQARRLTQTLLRMVNSLDSGGEISQLRQDLHDDLNAWSELAEFNTDMERFARYAHDDLK